MKKILLILFTFIFVSISFSQTFIPRSSSSVTPVDYYLKVRMFYLPVASDTTLAGGLDSLGAHLLVIKSGDTSLYVRVPGTGVNKWKKILMKGDLTGSVWGTITGTLSNQTDLQNALNLKLDSVRRKSGTDTIYGWYNGAKTFQFLSSGTGGGGLDSVLKVGNTTVHSAIFSAIYGSSASGQLTPITFNPRTVDSSNQFAYSPIVINNYDTARARFDIDFISNFNPNGVPHNAGRDEILKWGYNPQRLKPGEHSSYWTLESSWTQNFGNAHTQTETYWEQILKDNTTIYRPYFAVALTDSLSCYHIWRGDTYTFARTSDALNRLSITDAGAGFIAYNNQPMFSWQDSAGVKSMTMLLTVSGPQFSTTANSSTPTYSFINAPLNVNSNNGLHRGMINTLSGNGDFGYYATTSGTRSGETQPAVFQGAANGQWELFMQNQNTTSTNKTWVWLQDNGGKAGLALNGITKQMTMLYDGNNTHRLVFNNGTADIAHLSMDSCRFVLNRRSIFQPNTTPLISLQDSAGNVFNSFTTDDSTNTWIGKNSGAVNNVAGGGKNSIAIGLNALNSQTTGNLNVAIGNSSQKSLTTGTSNTSVGMFALRNITNGIENTALGYRALDSVTGATDNIAIGANAMLTNKVGIDNIAIGDDVLSGAQSINNNIVIGHESVSKGSSGSNNVVVGTNTQINNNIGSNNVWLGYSINSKTGTTITNSVVLGENITVALGNAIILGNTTHNTLLGTDSNTTNNGSRLQVYGDGYLSDSLILNKAIAGTSSDSVLVQNSSTHAIHKVVQSGVANAPDGIGTIPITTSTSTFMAAPNGSFKYDTTGTAAKGSGHLTMGTPSTTSDMQFQSNAAIGEWKFKDSSLAVNGKTTIILENSGGKQVRLWQYGVNFITSGLSKANGAIFYNQDGNMQLSAHNFDVYISSDGGAVSSVDVKPTTHDVIIRDTTDNGTTLQVRGGMWMLKDSTPLKTSLTTQHLLIIDTTATVDNTQRISLATLFTAPAFTGIPTAPTASALTNTTQIATTAFVNNAVNARVGVANYAHVIFTPTTGGTVNLTNNTYNIINPAGALVALTVNLPSSPSNNDVVYIKYTQSITTVTYANGTVVDGITAPTAGGLTVLVFDSGTNSWY